MAALQQGQSLDRALRAELQRGERILWQGRPIGRINRAGFGLYFFGIPWTAFALFWTVMAFAGVNIGVGMPESPAGWLAYAFPLFGLPFILIGLVMLAGPFMPLLHSGKRIFALTDRRIMEVYSGRSITVTTYQLDRLGSVSRKQRRDGSGTLKIERGAKIDSEGYTQVQYVEIGEIENVAALETLLREAKERRGRPRRELRGQLSS